MRTTLFLISVGLFACQSLKAQTILRIKGGPNWQNSIPVVERYYFPQFCNGKITYTNGQAATGQLNYNILLGEMQFIDGKGDTLSLANEQTIQSVQIGSTNYIYDLRNGYLQVLDTYGLVTLVSKPIFKTIRAEKNGGYGQSSGSSSIAQYKSFAGSNGQIARLEQPGDLLLEKATLYLFADANRQVHKASKAAASKLFAKNKAALNNYLKSRNVDFQNKQDLRNLLKETSLSF